jgi:hypothetical protein
MDKRNSPAPRAAAEELAALIHMTRFMSDTVLRLVDDPHRLKEQLARLEAELQTELQLADTRLALRRAN